MSQKYPGGFITKNPVAPTSSAASGIWTLDQQQQAQKAGTWPSPPIFIEDLFSTYLVTGDGTAPAVNNGIDVSGQGGLVWIKKRSAAGSHSLFDTARGANLRLISNDTAAQDSVNLSFTSTGFSNYTFDSGVTYASWTFAEQPKFFDVVTYTGNGTAGRAIAHNLGSVPGCIIVKQTNTAREWAVYHRSLGATKYLWLNSSNAEDASLGYWNNTEPTSTNFTIGDGGRTNGAGDTYVAYVFAHDAGGFPVSGSGSTNGISCGSYTGSGGVDTITLGYEPQWILMKATAGMPWRMFDTMRGMSYTDNVYLDPSTSDAEVSYGTSYVRPTPTGFTVQPGFYGTGATVIYIAIRRGPMKTPTVGTSVFNLQNANEPVSTPIFSAGTAPPDFILQFPRYAGGAENALQDRLRGNARSLTSTSTAAETSPTAIVPPWFFNTGQRATIAAGAYYNNGADEKFVQYSFIRAPGFFDEVCYTGTEVSGQTFNHNLGAVPEMMIVKSRSGTTDWTVYHSALGASARIYLNATNAANTGTAAPWNSTTPTSSVFSLGNAGATNLSGGTFVNYLFATVAGVSKVGTYTGTGALLTVDCGFTSGARFVLIKRTDSTGDWFTYDSARGITSGNDPYLLMNSTAAEVTGTNYVDTDTTGFKVTAAAPAGLNANGGTYIFLAIA